MARTCGTMSVHYRLLETDPSYRIALGNLEHASEARRRQVNAVRATPYKINVVVHVVWNTATENISDAQVQSQIDALNRDYRRTNKDVSSIPAPWQGLAADSNIEFALNTINRVKTTKLSFGDDNSVKSTASGGSDVVSPTKFLNLWVCNLGGGLLGYAQFPTAGPAATDGVVILNTAFGTLETATAPGNPYNLGRTATHEVGHYLNLHHIWGDTSDCTGTDFVDDTPNAQHPNFGKPVFPHISCQNGPLGDMFMDYMDYVDDAAMVLFTAGQVSRMHATLDGPRASLVTP